MIDSDGSEISFIGDVRRMCRMRPGTILIFQLENSMIVIQQLRIKRRKWVWEVRSVLAAVVVVKLQKSQK